MLRHSNACVRDVLIASSNVYLRDTKFTFWPFTIERLKDEIFTSILYMRPGPSVFQHWGSQKKLWDHRIVWSSEMSEENLATKSSNNPVISQRIFDDPQNVEKLNGPWSQMRSQFSPCNEIHLLILWTLIVNIPSSNFEMKFFLRKMVFLTFLP